MYILASSSDWQLLCPEDANSIKKILYLDADWYEILSNIDDLKMVRKLAKNYFSFYSQIAGVPLIIEENDQFSVFIRAAGFTQETIKEHIRLVKQNIAIYRNLNNWDRTIKPLLSYYPLPRRKQIVN